MSCRKVEAEHNGKKRPGPAMQFKKTRFRPNRANFVPLMPLLDAGNFHGFLSLLKRLQNRDPSVFVTQNSSDVSPVFSKKSFNGDFGAVNW